MLEKLRVMNNIIPAGHYTLTVIGVPEKLNDKANSRKWKFGIYQNGKVQETFFAFLPPWEARELIVEVGGIPNGDYVEWDDEKVDGKFIECDLGHKEYTNKNNEVKTKYVLSNISATIPF